MITQVTYERLFNLGNYESERISATATVESADIESAYDEARTAVMDEFMRNTQARTTTQPERPPAEYAPLRASEKQIAFIRSLAADLDWTDEQLDTFAGGEGLGMLTTTDASALIGLLKKETREERIIDWSKRVSGAPAEKPGIVGSADIPF